MLAHLYRPRALTCSSMQPGFCVTVESTDIAFIFVGRWAGKGEMPSRSPSAMIFVMFSSGILYLRARPGRSYALLILLCISLRDIAVFKYGLSSNKLFDYLASGRPIVSSCAIEDTPVSASGGGICVPPESPEEIADALVRLASMSAAERHAMGERGRQWVYQHHGVTALAGRFLDALVQAQR